MFERNQGGPMNEMQLSRSIGWFSVGLGAAELFAPQAVADLIGLNSERHPILRAMGLREIAHGIGILSAEEPEGWVWSHANKPTG